MSRVNDNFFYYEDLQSEGRFTKEERTATIERPFQKINYKLNEKQKEKNYKQFSVYKIETKREINKTIWNGRDFISDTESTPHGYTASSSESS